MTQLTRLFSFFAISLFISISSLAKVEILFHPYDPTLAKAAQWIREAHQEINLIMYNIDATDGSPVVQALKEPMIQERIKNHSLKIRLIFGGAGDKQKAAQKMTAFEQLGVDCRSLGTSLNIHHKFAVIDSGTPWTRLISGSANWSLGSMQNYNENILFMEHEPEISQQYAVEFYHWWQLSKEFGQGPFADLAEPQKTHLNPELFAYFNSINFKDTHVSNREAFTLAHQLVAAIDQARTEIQIATTRIKLRPVYDALIRAAQRGVHISIVVSMDEFEYPSKRGSAPGSCTNSWSTACSEAKNFSDLLSIAKASKLPIELRVKIYNLNTSKYITHQMHSKYMIIDKTRILSGSYNWSVSAENQHIENIISISGQKHPEALRSILNDFTQLWNMGRTNYDVVKTQFYKAASQSLKINCFFQPQVLSFEEIDALLFMPTADGKVIRVSNICN